MLNNNSKFLGIDDGKKWTKINRIKKIFNMVEDEGQTPCSSGYVRVSLANTDVVVFVNEENRPTYKLHSISPNNIDYMLEKITKLLKLKKIIFTIGILSISLISLFLFFTNHSLLSIIFFIGGFFAVYR